MRAKTPAAGGFRMPAEWEPHEATWLGWPHRLSDWPGRFAPIPWVFGEILRRLAPRERVRILVGSKARESGARRLLARVGVEADRVDFFRFPTDRGWTRDFDPIFVRRDGPPAEVAIARFRFNVANGVVLVPTFNDPVDRIALGALAELFHDRTVAGIHAVDLIWGLGTLHCLTQQQPAR